MEEHHGGPKGRGFESLPRHHLFFLPSGRWCVGVLSFCSDIAADMAIHQTRTHAIFLGERTSGLLRSASEGRAHPGIGSFAAPGRR